MNSVLSSNQSIINKLRDESQIKNNLKAITPVISQKPKTADNNLEMLPKKTSNLSNRLKVNSNISSLLNLHTNISTSSHEPKVLSPLSPGQVLADGNITKLQQSSINSIVSVCIWIVSN